MEGLIGEQAGRVWHVLSDGGPKTIKDLAKLAGLKEAEVQRAIGWLAREGKLTYESDAKKGLVKVGLK